MSAVRKSPISVKWPLAIVAVAASAIAYVRYSARIEDVFRFRDSVIVCFVTFIAIGICVLVSRFGWRTKMLLLCTPVLTIAAAFPVATRLLKREGTFSGDGTPRLVWKWTRPADATLAPALLASESQPSQTIDLDPRASDWMQFLGPRRDNSVEDPNLSADWAANPPKQLWRQPTGAGWGSFAIVNDSAFTQEQRGAQSLTTCLDVRSGAIRWQHANPVRFTEKMGGDGPRATPTVIDGRVYVMGATGILDCLEGHTGNPIWSRNVLNDAHAGNVQWGKSCSPLLVDGMVIVSGGDVGPTLLAYDARDGKPRWQAGTDPAAYDSPAPATIAGRQEIVLVSGGAVSGFDRSSGAVRWSFPWPGNPARAAQPMLLPGDRIFISAAYGMGCTMLQVSANSAGDQSVKPLWRNKNLRTIFNNAVCKDGFIYGLDDGVLTCIDCSTGERRWRDGRYGHGQLLLVGNNLLIQAESGAIALVQAAPETYHELSRFPALDGKTWNNPVLCGNLLLVRNDHEAACFELPASPGLISTAVAK
jgi:outer membrane protein assembly factor BamB